MAKVISLEERRLMKALQADVSTSLAHISKLTRKLYERDHAIHGYSSLQEWLGGLINGEIMRRGQVSEEIFLCGMYIATMLAAADCNLKQYAIDFLDRWSATSDPRYLKMGGDFCFVLCGAFAGSCDRRMMRLKDYQDLGASFYDWFYSSSGKVIGHYMSVNFGFMQDIVNSILPKRSLL